MEILIRKVAIVTMLFFALVGVTTVEASMPPLGYDKYEPGSGIAENSRKNPLKALSYDEAFKDSPLADGSYNFVSLGFGGSIILTVLDGYSISNGDGYDFKLFETTYGDNALNWDSYKETAKVFAYQGQYDSEDENWIQLGFAKQDGEFDLGSLLFTTAIKIVDVSREYGFTGVGDGYDLDGMVINNVGRPVPIPGAAFLLAPVLLGLVGLRRRQLV